MNDYKDARMARIFIGISIILFVAAYTLKNQWFIDFYNSHTVIEISNEIRCEALQLWGM